MAGRNHIPVSSPGRRHQHHPLDDRRSKPPQGRFPPPEVQLMEDRIAAQSHEIQTLVMDNQRLAATHVALKQDVTAVEQEVRRLSATASSIKAEKDAQVREVYERYLKLEAEARPIEGLAAELNRVRKEIELRVVERKELSEKLKDIDGEIAKTKSELQQSTDIKAEIDKMHSEIQRGRRAIESEKRMESHNFKVAEAMEKHLAALNQEAEILRSELANAEKKAAVDASAAVSAAKPGPDYAVRQTNLNPAYGGNPLSDPYAVHQGTFDTSSGYASRAVSQGPQIPYDAQGQQIQS